MNADTPTLPHRMGSPHQPLHPPYRVISAVDSAYYKHGYYRSTGGTKGNRGQKWLGSGHTPKPLAAPPVPSAHTGYVTKSHWAPHRTTHSAQDTQ